MDRSGAGRGAPWLFRFYARGAPAWVRRDSSRARECYSRGGEGSSRARGLPEKSGDEAAGPGPACRRVAVVCSFIVVFVSRVGNERPLPLSVSLANL